MFRTYEHVLEENIKMWGIIHVHKFLINMWECSLWECILWERVPSPKIPCRGEILLKFDFRQLYVTPFEMSIVHIPSVKFLHYF